MVGALFVVGQKLIRAAWISRKAPVVMSGFVLPFTLWMRSEQLDQYEDWMDVLDALGVTREEMIQSQQGELRAFGHKFSRQVLAEKAGPEWEEYFSDFVDVPLCLLSREVMLLFKVFDYVKSGDIAGLDKYKVSVMDIPRFVEARFACPPFMASTDFTIFDGAFDPRDFYDANEYGSHEEKAN